MKKTWTQEQLAAAAARYISEHYGAVPSQEPARTDWYASYGLLIDFTSFVWERLPTYAPAISGEA